LGFRKCESVLTLMDSNLQSNCRVVVPSHDCGQYS